MAKIPGRYGRLSVSNDGGASWFAVGGLMDTTFNGNQDELETTSHEDGQFRTYISGRKDATVDLTLHWDESDVGQAIVRDAFFSATELACRFRMQEGSGFQQHEATAIVTSFTESSPNDDVADVDVTLRISGDFSSAAQP